MPVAAKYVPSAVSSQSPLKDPALPHASAETSRKTPTRAAPSRAASLAVRPVAAQPLPRPHTQPAPEIAEAAEKACVTSVCANIDLAQVAEEFAASSQGQQAERLFLHGGVVSSPRR